MNSSTKGTKIKNNSPNIRVWGIVVMITIVVVVIFSISVFFVDRFKIPGITHSCWGNFGDFIGGILVPLLSAYSFFLLIRTLVFQLQSNNLVSDSNNLTQFNEMFKLLLDEYHSTIKEYSYNGMKGREALKLYKDNIFNKGKVSTGSSLIESRHNDAVNEFETFYATYRPIASIQFKLLYRIMNLVETSNIHEDRKQEVVKIIRCQLSEQELFFLRYDAFSRYGEKMQDLINKYNLLKHLPTLSTYEFAKYASIINDDTHINIVNNYLYTLRQETVKLLNREGKDNSKNIILSECYYAILQVEDNYSTFSISINRIEKEPASQPIDGVLDKLEKQNLLSGFLEDFSIELFVFSNFGKLNNSPKISQETKRQTDNGINIDTYTIKIKKCENRPYLYCTYSQCQ